MWCACYNSLRVFHEYLHIILLDFYFLPWRYSFIFQISFSFLFYAEILYKYLFATACIWKEISTITGRGFYSPSQHWRRTLYWHSSRYVSHLCLICIYIYIIAGSPCLFSGWTCFFWLRSPILMLKCLIFVYL